MKLSALSDKLEPLQLIGSCEVLQVLLVRVSFLILLHNKCVFYYFVKPILLCYTFNSFARKP